MKSLAHKCLIVLVAMGCGTGPVPVSADGGAAVQVAALDQGGACPTERPPGCVCPESQTCLKGITGYFCVECAP